jgi:hypothetical protein
VEAIVAGTNALLSKKVAAQSVKSLEAEDRAGPMEGL